MPQTLPSIAELKRRFSYDPGTGMLRWRISVAQMKKGDIAGTISTNGYVYVNLRGNGQVGAHRIIWAMMTGKWSRKLIDHADRKKANNKWSNLREATRSQNTVNSKTRADNTCGYKGVIFCRSTGRYRARIMKDGCLHELGRHDTPESAYAAYSAAAKALDPEFVRLEGLRTDHRPPIDI